MTVAATGVGARLDALPITRRHRRATVAVGLGLFFEFYEVFLAGVLSGVLVSDFGVTKAQVAPLLASTFVGMFLGAVVLGRLADKAGRRGAFLLTLGVYSTASLLGAFSPNAVWLMVTRFLAGIGLGAEPPLADTYLADLLPARRRGRFTAWAYTIAFCGVPVVGFLARGIAQQQVLGIQGWRWLFVIGAVGGFAVFLLRRGLPESPRWLEAAGRRDEAEAITAEFEAEAAAQHGPDATVPAERTEERDSVPARGPRDLLRPPQRRRTLMMAVFQVFQTLGYYGFGTLVPLVLAAKGFPVADSLLFTAVTFLGYPLGSAASIPLVERIERKWLVAGSGLAMAALGLAFGFSSALVPILVFGFLYTAVSNVFSNSFHIYQVEIFPTALRATASSSTYSLSRLATAAMPFVLVPLLNGAGPGALFAVVSAAMVIVAVDVLVLGPRTTGRGLEDVSRGRSAA